MLDIGGGSTEVVVGQGSSIEFFVSTQLGSVRHTERHLHTDPPTPAGAGGLPGRCSRRARVGGAARRCASRCTRASRWPGTPTSFAAIELALDPYDPDRVEGHRLTLAACERILGELAALPLAERRLVTGLHPDRAPTIVAGGAILVEAMRLFGLGEIEVSERDILHGAALEAARSS